MTKWPYSKMTDHKDKALKRFTDQYVDAENLKNLIKLSADRIQLLEEAIWDLLTKRSVEESVGRQLDLLGEIFGERRLARNDEDFRDAILLRIALNRSGGDPETIVTFLKALSGSENVFIQENFPATLTVFTLFPLTPENLLSIQSIMAVGVQLFFLEGSADPNEKPFGIKETGLPDPEDRGGFGEFISTEFFPLELSSGEILELSSGETLDLVVSSDPPFVTGGGILVELFEF